jgi:NAD(P)-dependent dehydrogenase (short-subunit alcohol dehydrogenase family)
VPSVLISGASRGIGRATTLRLARAGWTVYATVRHDADGTALVADAVGGDVHPLALDVTSDEQIAALPDALPERLDAVVNNAGVVVSGPVEGLAPEELRRQLDVNVVGQAAVTQAVLPRIRAARGRIVFVSSVSGRASSPFLGAYSASKFALEGLADALRLELRPWSIPVILVEPGSIDTDLWRNADKDVDDAEAAMTPQLRDLYAERIAGMRKTVKRIQGQTSPVEKVSAAIVKALTDDKPKARYLVGIDAKTQVALRAALPTRAFDALVSRATGGR